VSRGGAILASLLVTLGRPAWWLLALAAFLVRGGFVVFLVPIVVLPSPLAISNVAAPFVVPMALGRIGPEVFILLIVAGMALFGWLLIGGAVAAATDVALIRDAVAAAADEGVAPQTPAPPLPQRSAAPIRSERRDGALVGTIVAARLVAWLPLAAALAIGLVRIVAVTYVELTRPAELESPLALRVAVGAAGELVVMGVAWLFGELVGGLAARWIVLDGASVGRALAAAARDIVRRPGSTLLPWLVTTAMLFTILGGTVGAAGIAWSRVIVALSARTPDSATVAISLVIFVAIWLAALVLGGLFAAIRSSVLTFEHVRVRAQTGTFGASVHHRPGDRSIADRGGSL
jgi:hypothetical protein